MYTHIYRIAHEMSYHLIIQFSGFDNEICINFAKNKCYI